jgi:hypothetical protein
MPQEVFIEIQDNIYDALRCPAFYGDGTAAIQIASNLDAPYAPIVTSELINYIPMEFDIANIEEGSDEVTGTYRTDPTIPNYAITLNMFNDDDPDVDVSIYSHIITNKSASSFTAIFSDVMDSEFYSVSYDHDSGEGNSGVAHIPDGTNRLTVDLTGPPPEFIDDTSYTIALSIENTVDANPSFYQYVVVERTLTHFTVEFSDNIDSNNYYLNWIVVNHSKQDVEQLSYGSTEVTIPLNPYEVNDNYGVQLQMINTIDATVSLIPFIVVDKSIDGFKVKFDSPIDSPNYALMWSRPTSSSLYVDEYEYYQSGGFENFDGVPAFDGTSYVYVEGTQGRFDCTHGFDLVQIEIEDTIAALLQENEDDLLQEDGSRILLNL